MNESFTPGADREKEGLFCWSKKKYEIVQGAETVSRTIGGNYYVYWSSEPPVLSDTGDLALPNSQGGVPPAQVTTHLAGKYVKYGSFIIKATSGMSVSNGAGTINGYAITRETVESVYVVADDPEAYPASGKQGDSYYESITK